MRTSMGFTRVVAIAAGLALSSTALAQFTETEPNDTKAASNAVGPIAVAGTITGNSTGASTTVAGPGSADYYLVTVAAPPSAGIYRYRMVLSSATSGHIGTLRGLNTAAGAVTANTDLSLQGSIATTTPPAMNQWYGLGSGTHQLYYRVEGTASTTSDYTATLERQAVVPVVLTGSVPPGSVLIRPTAAAQTAYDTDFWVYDSSFNAIPLGGRDDPDGTGVSLSLVPGTYYIGISNYNVINNRANSLSGDWLTGGAADFPNIVIGNYTGTGASPLAVEVLDSTGTNVLATGSGATLAGTATAFDVQWFSFTVAVPTGPTPGNCSASPTSVPNTGGNVALSTTVVPGTGSSTIVSVTADLSAFGLGTSVPLSNGGSGLTYTYNLAVPNGQAGGNYPIVLTARDGANLTGQCTVNLLVIPPGQTCATPIAATLGTTYTGNVQLSTQNSTIPCSSGLKGVWYSFAAAFGGNHTFTATNTSGDAGNPSVAVYASCGGANLACINPCGGTVATATVNLTAGQTYFVRVGACGDAGNSAFNFVIDAVPGACCASSGCSIVSPAACASAGGNFIGGVCESTVLSYARSYSATPGLPIPDNDPVGINSIISVPDTFTFTDVSVRVNIPDHTFIADLIITLSKDGTPVIVWNEQCGGNNGLNVTFSDAGVAVVCAEPTVGEYLPNAALSALNGVASAGDWTLNVSDNAGADLGTLASWSVGFNRSAQQVSNCPTVSNGRCCVGARCVVGIDSTACAALAVAPAGRVFTASATNCNATGTLNTPCCFADYNKVGGIGVQDIFDFLTGWFSNSPNANVQGDGTAPGVQDIFDFLSGWFSGGC